MTSVAGGNVEGIHHCMRTIGVAEAGIEAMAKRLLGRADFDKRLAEQSVWEERIARARIDIEMARLPPPYNGRF